MRPGKLLALTSLAILAPAAVIVAWGLTSLAQETERASARYREQAASCARAVGDAAAAVAREVELAQAPALAFRADREGTLSEPTFAARAVERADEMVEVVRAEIDGLEREGELYRARERLRELAQHEDRPALAAWALTSLAAIELRAGNVDVARAAWREIVERFPETRDERGLKRAHAARFALAETAEERLALYADLIADRTALEQTATAALAERVAERLRATPSTEYEQLAEDERVFVRKLQLAASWPRGASDWLAQGAPGGARSFELAADPMRPAQERVLVGARAGEGGSWNGGALEHAALARAALARPEIEAWRALGFAAALETRDGALLAGDAAPAGDAAVVELLGAPLDSLVARAFGTDFEGFVATQRRRFALVASLSGVAWLIAAIAAFATVRAVSREARAAKERQDFVAAVTHELKAPLASIRLLAELLERGDVEEAKVREFGARTVVEADRLSRVVSSVLELARIERGAPQANGAARERIDLAQLAREVLSSLEPRARQRGFAVELRAGTAEVLGNRDALHGALLELLDNALTHAREPHTIEVEVAADERFARVTVLDRGPGVPQAERERIFEPFRRLGDELTRERPGVGLGLALVARVAAAHGGRVLCEPRDGGGSRFTLELPLAPTSTQVAS